jgi:Spy/CpxP family protein refolding chaperone
VGVGCDESDSTGDLLGNSSALAEADAVGDLAAGGAFAGLTIEAIDERVNLTDEQREEMVVALGRLQAAHEERMEQRGRGSGRRGGGPGWHDGRFGGPAEGEQPGERPILVFLEDSAEILTQEQLADLLDLMKELRDAWRAEHRGSRFGDRGDGPGECFGEGRGRGPGKGFGGRHGDGPGDRFGGRHGDGPGPIFEQLNLSDEQRSQIEEILKTQHEQIRAIREQVREGSLDREQAREQIHEIRQEGRAQIEAILTPEQLEQWEALHQERLEERVGERIERLGQNIDRHIEFLEKVLSLSADQVSQVREILGGSVDARKEILQQVIDGSLDRKEAHDQMRAVMEGVADSIAALLTPEQQEVWEALRDLLPRRGHK